MQFLPADVFPLEGDDLPEGKDGWLILLDEITGVANSMQTAALKLIQEKLVGNRKLHEKTYIAAAGNLGSDGAVITPLQSTIYNRFAVYYVDQNFESWKDWAMTASANIHPLVLAYLSIYPDQLHTFDADAEDPRFASPRAWEAASRLLMKEDSVKTLDKAELSIGMNALIGTVSNGFLNWLINASTVLTAQEIHEAIDTNSIKDLTRKLPKDEDVDKFLIVSNNLIYALKNNSYNDKQVNKAIKWVINEFPNNTLIVFTKELNMIKPEYMELPAMEEMLEDMTAKMEKLK